VKPAAPAPDAPDGSHCESVVHLVPHDSLERGSRSGLSSVAANGNSTRPPCPLSHVKFHDPQVGLENKRMRIYGFPPASAQCAALPATVRLWDMAWAVGLEDATRRGTPSPARAH